MQRKMTADSSANLYAADCADFTPVPLRIVTAEREYCDDAALDVPAMLGELKSYTGRSGTSCPSVEDWLAAFGDAEEVFGVALTSRLSGCYNTALVAAQDYREAHPGRRVFILDSKSTGPEMELLVERGCALLPTDRRFTEVCDALTAYWKHTHLAFSLESLDNFAKNGRVSPVLAKAAGLLGIRIVGRASASGDLEPLHKCRGEKAAVEQLTADLLAAGYAGGRVRIRHSANRPMAAALAAELRLRFPGCDVRIAENRGICSFYAEKGGLLVGFEDAGAPEL